MKKIVSILLVLLLVASKSFADVYYENIATNKGFYIYNVAAKGYIKNNNGQMMLVNNISDASVWQFTVVGSGQATAISNEGKYITIDEMKDKLQKQYDSQKHYMNKTRKIIISVLLLVITVFAIFISSLYFTFISTFSPYNPLQ
mgnify:CR=1 FL=1